MHVLVEPPYMNSHWYTHFISGINMQAKLSNVPVRIHTDLDFAADPEFSDTHILVLGSSLTWTSEMITFLHANGVHPIVLNIANYQNEFPYATFISTDYADATKRIFRFFKANGRTKTAFFAGGRKSSTDVQKISCFLAEGGQSEDIYNFDGSMQELLDSLFYRILKYDSIICANDISGVILVRQLIAQGYKLPSDMHVVAFGCSILTSLEVRNVTVAKVKNVESGRLAVHVYNLLKSNPAVSSSSYLLRCDLLDNVCEPAIPSGEVSIKTESATQAASDFFHDSDVQEVLLVEKLLSNCDDLDIDILRGVLSRESYSKISARLYISENTISYRIKKILALAPDMTKEQIFKIMAEYIPI